MRRDLKEMQAIGLLERSHGGAILTETTEEVSIFFRLEKNAKQKERIATTALSHLPPFKSLFVDSSSTALALLQRMDLRFKTVVTNGLQTALQLSKKEDVHLILLGGNVQYNTHTVLGSLSSRLLNDFSFDLMICSCASVKPNGAFERSLEQAEIKRSALSQSEKSILLVDDSKLQAPATHRITDLSAFHHIITNVPPKTEFDDVRFIY
jgi:DeoR/GlpR family transcriptional regulator of sugar metabolism